jgi:hypothetical protein
MTINIFSREDLSCLRPESENEFNMTHLAPTQLPTKDLFKLDRRTVLGVFL